MIVKTNTDGALAFPVSGENRTIELSPGWNEVDNVDWAKTRKNALRKIKSGKVAELFKTVAKKDIPADLPEGLRDIPDDKDADKFQIPVTIADLGNQNNRVVNMIKETFHIPTLNKWLEQDSRSDIRATIMKQLDGIEKGTIKG
jgi:hypothetical protein